MYSFLRQMWNDNVSYEGGWSVVWIDGLLLIPLLFAAFFYPVQVLMFAGVPALAVFAAYEGHVMWRRRHPRQV